MIYVLMGLILSLTSPLLLIPVEKLLPYPYLVEEIIKLVILFFLLKPVKPSVIWVILAGLLFALSESILYLSDILVSGNLLIFPLRLGITGVLHTSTIVLMYLSSKLGWFGLLLGFACAILIHFFYNLWIVNFNFF